MSVNKVILIGNLGADPESRAMPNGNPVVNLRLATSESWKDKATGEKRERTEWHRVCIFDERLCDVATKYLKKGSKVYLEGQIRTSKWTDQQGNDKYTTEVVLARFSGVLQLLDSREGGHEKPLAAPVDPNKPLDGPMPDLDDNIPFSPCK